MWRAILIDDEEIALDVMDIMLNEVGGVKVVGRFQLVAEALGQCSALQPDLIFLDIEMPGVSGLEAAGELAASCPDAEIVFVTAHDQYAIDAYDTEAIGYLLKPVAEDKLVRVLSRYANRQAKKKIHSGDSVEGSSLSVAGLAAKPESRAEDKPALSLKVLGSMELYAPDGRLLTWRTKKTKELFAFLWHHRKQLVYKYAILEQLWPDDPAERGQKLLHTSLYYLRSLFKSVGYEGVVKYGDDRYWIDASSVRSDLEDLLGGLEQGGAGADIKDILQLYAGDYLEMEYYDWANAYRIELRSTLLSTMTAALDRATDESRMLLLWKLIEVEPSQGHYYDFLADVLSRSGDKAGVRQVHAMKEQIRLDEG